MGRGLREEVFTATEVCVVFITQRCVRSQFLTGKHAPNGRDYSYRKDWIIKRLEALASVAACDVLGLAIMDNHFHVLVRNRPDVAATWSDEEVAIRWLKIYPGQRIEEQLGSPTQADVDALLADTEKLAEVRLRLSDISWFMRALSEPIARRANKEDDCTGRFWEGRFKPLRILDMTVLLACLIYMDLNPLRASVAKVVEEARYTSAYARLKGRQGDMIDSAAFDLKVLSPEEAGDFHKHKTVDQQRAELAEHGRGLLRSSGRQILRDAWLAPMQLTKDELSSDPQVHQDGLRASDRGFLRMDVDSYLSLLRCTAKSPDMDPDGRDAEIAEQVLSEMSLDGEMWRDMVGNCKRYFASSSCMGSGEAMAAHAEKIGKRWHRGQRWQRRQQQALAARKSQDGNSAAG